jgi:hypothetical protein
MIVRTPPIAPGPEPAVAPAPDGRAADAAASRTGSWLAVLVRMLRLPERQRVAIRDELEEHLRERVRDLVLAGRAEADAQREAVEELGETAQLARRLEHANRSPVRRRIMNLSLIGLGGLFVTAGALTVSSVTNTPYVSVYQGLDDQTEPPPALEELTMPIAAGSTLEDVVATMDAAIPEAVLVRWDEIECVGGNRSMVLGVAIDSIPVAAAGKLVTQALAEIGPYEWRYGDRVIELAHRDRFDQREIVLVSYRIGPLLEALAVKLELTTDGARNQVVSLVHELVDADSWRANGGRLAGLQMVGGTLFVEAPRRMQARVQWIIEELDTEAGMAGGTPAEAPEGAAAAAHP